MGSYDSEKWLGARVVTMEGKHLVLMLLLRRIWRAQLKQN